MSTADLDQLERLQRLREKGTLTEAEFRSEKQKLLAPSQVRAPAVTRRVLVTVALAGGASIALAVGAWTTFLVRPREASTPSSSPAPISAVVPAQAPAATGRAAAPLSLRDAFEAATGHRSAFTRREGQDEVTIKPIRLLQLPFGPALLTSREIKDGCHACTGSIGVYYLKSDAGRTLIVGRWPKAVEGWGWGAAPSEWRITNNLTSFPAIYASGGFMGQGVVESSSTLTELFPSGPLTSDVIGTGFSDEGAIADNERVPCVVSGKIANIRKDRSFDVVITGSVRGVDHYVKRNGRYVAAAKIDWGLPCEKLAAGV